MTNIEKRLTFALIPGTADQPPTLVIGMTQAAFAAMQGGKFHHVDLEKVGIPLRLITFGGDDHDAIMKTLWGMTAAAGQPALDERRASFGIDGLDEDAP